MGKDSKSNVKRTRSTTMIEIVKPPADMRAYRVVILPNGITAMLISEALYYPVEDSKPDMDVEDMEVEEFEKEEYVEGEAAAALCVGAGSFSDLPEIPGFAHFMEHMVFMGSKKFPKENYWDEFLAKNRGESNAWTDCERTCFFFVSQQSEFVKALDIFAQFFIGPLFNKNSVDREIMAVDNECQMVASNDNERVRSVMSHELVEQGHPMKKFMAGNKKSLKDDPEQKHINVYEQLHAFYRRMYSAHYMTLVIHSMDTLDVIEKQIIRIFSKIPNNAIPRPKFIKPPFQERSFNKLLKVIPMEDVHKMELIWALPPLMDHYRARVIEFLSLLLGHEGKGSILSVLRKRHLALEMSGGNDMTGYTHNSTWSAFILSIKLTDVGMKQYEEVLGVIFQYILLLKKDLPAHVFEEQKHIEETKYIFKEQDSIYSYVEELAENMHMYPPEHYLCGRTLYFEYNEQLIRECLDFLKPQGMLIMLYNKVFINLPGLREEPWLGTKYAISDVDNALIKRLNNVSLNPDLAAPEPNPYIATNFNLVKTRKSTKCPVVVMSEGGCRIWYKKDTVFHTPNAYIYFNFISSAISKNTKNVALADIVLTCLLHKLTETLYNATLAGYEYSVEGTPEGVVFFIGGYSEKIKVVTEDTLSCFKDLVIDEGLFHSVVTHLKQVYINELIKPVELARAVRYSVLEMMDPSLIERYEQVGSITFPMIGPFLEEFYCTMFIEGYVTGNLKPQDAVDIGKSALKVIKKPLPESEIPKPVVLELPVGENKCFMPAVNKEDTNSCVVQYFQQGPGSIRNYCLNEVLGAAMNEPLFNSLRTEKQLGYSVYCNPTTTHGVLGFSVVVESQANRFSMKQVNEIITKFLLEFCRSLEEMSAEKVKDLIESQAVLRSSEDGDLFDESSRFWQEILKQSYLFNRMKLEFAALESITQGDLIDWCKNTLIADERRQLSLMVEGCSKDKCQFATGESSLSTISSLIKGLKTCMPMGRPGRPDPACEGECVAKPQDHGSNYITNLCQFKSQLKALPQHVIKS
ncbi:nardilysin [Aplysia californica]|uniref:Nardilysin n=1 Tax=Aplysia californica TaxID=6500 RepID=A0ABM0K0L0_APLCA|nr:nardilysin [Aplysia californica]